MAKRKNSGQQKESIIGEFIREKIRAKGGVEDKDVAKFLNVSIPTWGRNYLSDDLYLSKLEKFSVFLNEDILRQFYYSKEPLKRFKDAEEQVWLKKIEDLEIKIQHLQEVQSKMQEHIDTQKSFIEHLKDEITLQKK